MALATMVLVDPWTAARTDRPASETPAPPTTITEAVAAASQDAGADTLFVAARRPSFERLQGEVTVRWWEAPP